MHLNDNIEKEIECEHDPASLIPAERNSRGEFTREECLRIIAICFPEIIRASGKGNMLMQFWKLSQEIDIYLISDYDGMEKPWVSLGQAMKGESYVVQSR